MPKKKKKKDKERPKKDTHVRVMNRNARAGTAQSEIRHQTWRWEKVTREGEKPETEKRQKRVEIGREDRQ